MYLIYDNASVMVIRHLEQHNLFNSHQNHTSPGDQTTMSTAAVSPVILILGAGANVGTHVARSFAAKGYRVALTSRTSPDQETTGKGNLHLQSDLTDPGSVAGVFAKVRDLLGPPSVVVYNGELALYSSDSGGKRGSWFPGTDVTLSSPSSSSEHFEPACRPTFSLCLRT